MSKNKVIKSVGFNKTNPDDAEILKAVKRRNFSGYVKKLILADIRANKTEVKKETAAEKLERMRRQMLTDKGVDNQTNSITND